MRRSLIALVQRSPPPLSLISSPAAAINQEIRRLVNRFMVQSAASVLYRVKKAEVGGVLKQVSPTSETIGDFKKEADYYSDVALVEVNGIINAIETVKEKWAGIKDLTVCNDSESSVNFLNIGKKKESWKANYKVYNEYLRLFKIYKEKFTYLEVRKVPRYGVFGADKLIGNLRKKKRKEFKHYVNKVSSLTQATDEDLLIMYGLFKQAKKGNVKTTRPEDPEGRAEWDSWKSCEGKSKDEAMTDYITKAKQLLEAEANGIVTMEDEKK